MKHSTVLKTILFLSGLIVTGIGGVILLTPVAYFASNGIDLGGNITLLNEVRAPGGALLASGLLIVTGVFVPKLTFTSAVIATLVYLSYGISRMLSIAIDGMPADALVTATIVEIVIGLVALFAVVTYRNSERQKMTS